MILFTDVKHDFHGDRGWTSRTTEAGSPIRKVMNQDTLRNLITILLSPPPPPSTGGSTFYKQTGGENVDVNKSIFIDEIRSVVMWLIFLRDLDNIQKKLIQEQSISEQSTPEGLKTPPTSSSQGVPFVTPQTGGVLFTNLLDDNDYFYNTSWLGSKFTNWLGENDRGNILTNIYNYITGNNDNITPTSENYIQQFNEITNSPYTIDGNTINELRRSKRISARDQKAFKLQTYVNSDDFENSIFADGRFGLLTIPEPTEAQPEPSSPVIVSQSTSSSTPQQPTSTAAAVTPGEIPPTETLENLGVRVNEIRNNLGTFLQNTCNHILNANINLNTETNVVALAQLGYEGNVTPLPRQLPFSHVSYRCNINNAASTSDNDFCPVTSVIDGMPQCNNYQDRLEYGDMDFTIRENTNQNNYYRGWVNSTNWGSSISYNQFPQSIRYSYEIRSNTLHIPRKNCDSFPLWLKGNSEQRGDANIHITLAKCLQTTLNYYANFIDIQNTQVKGQLIGSKINTFTNLYDISTTNTNNTSQLIFETNGGDFYNPSQDVSGNINGLGIILSKILLKGAGDLFQEINAICKWGGYVPHGPMYTGQGVRYNDYGNAQRNFRTNDRISGARAYYMWCNLNNEQRNNLFCGSDIDIQNRIYFSTGMCPQQNPSTSKKRKSEGEQHTKGKRKSQKIGGRRTRRKIYRKKRTKKSKKTPRTRKRRLKKGTRRRKIK